MSKRPFGGGLAQSQQAKQHRFRLLAIGGGSVLVCLVLALSVFFSSSRGEARSDIKSNHAASDIFGTVALVAPTDSVPAGTKLNSIPLREIHWPRGEVPEGAIRSMDEAKSLYAKVGLQANAPISRKDLTSSPTANDVSSLIPPDHRAVTIEVDATAGVEGWATPGAHVDVLLTYRDSEDGVKKTRVAVEDAVVLSYNGSLKQRGNRSSDGDVRVSQKSTVTLAVAAQDSLKVQTASAMGRITLALRSPTELGSMGKDTFRADEWDQPKKAPEPKGFSSKGFIKYTDEAGTSKEFQLGEDERWWESQDVD